jgi:hypothetical protein
MLGDENETIFSLKRPTCISCLHVFLFKTQRDLAQRCQCAHCQGMRRIILLTGLLLIAVLPANAGHTPPKVLLRVHVQTTGDGQSPLEAVTIPVPPEGDSIQIRAMPEVSERELIKADQDASTLHLYFNHVGKVNLSAVTAQNQGRMLVVLLNGIVIYAPIIDLQITNGELDIPHPVNPVILQLLQDEAQQNVTQAAKL